VAPEGSTKMNDTVMAEEMQTPKKVAFANKKYSNEEKRQREQEELDQLIEARQEPSEEVVEQEPANAEEKSFKKRYGDLRRHTQEKERSYEERISVLEGQLNQSTKNNIKLPTSDEDLEKWISEYPDVAAIVETIAIKKAKEHSAELEDRVKMIDEMRFEATKEKAEVELLRIHPDFTEIRDSDDFHEWADEQPKWVQDALYENSEDARSAARAIDLYKVDRGITKTKKSSNKDAAKSVSTKNTRSVPDSADSNVAYKESQVQRMSPSEYESKADDIMDAIRTGKFVYDVSGSAR
jgi:predicted nuclease with RNAse H fold